ncbi:hypothetical protein BC829DRAFT_415704 [Chytridium lagenaria]|nr:hypothetical protein BC829DRAFT_415704 [Chytridium lagenaria]
MGAAAFQKPLAKLMDAQIYASAANAVCGVVGRESSLDALGCLWTKFLIECRKFLIGLSRLLFWPQETARMTVEALNETDFTPLELTRVLKEKGWWKGFSYSNELESSGSSLPIVYDDDESFWEKAFQCGRWNGIEAIGRDVLFKPCPLLAEVIDKVEASLAGNVANQQVNMRFRCLDMGCGAGRDLAFLATRGGRFEKVNEAHYEVEEGLNTLGNWCWDLRGLDWMDGILNRARTLFSNLEVDESRYGLIRTKFRLDGSFRFYNDGDDSKENVSLSASITTKASSDLESMETVDLLLCVRFLARTHYRWMRRMVRPGGYVLVFTFYEGAQAFGAPKDPNHILQPGELRNVAFKDLENVDMRQDAEGWDAVLDGSWEVIVDRVEHIADGRPVQAFLARKRYGK